MDFHWRMFAYGILNERCRSSMLCRRTDNSPHSRCLTVANRQTAVFYTLNKFTSLRRALVQHLADISMLIAYFVMVTIVALASLISFSNKHLYKLVYGDVADDALHIWINYFFLNEWLCLHHTHSHINITLSFTWNPLDDTLMAIY